MDVISTIRENLKVHEKAWSHSKVPQWYLYENGPLDQWDGIQRFKDKDECPEWVSDVFKNYGAWSTKPSIVGKVTIPNEETETFEMYVAKWQGQGENGATLYLSEYPLLHLTLIRVGYRNGDVISVG